MLGYYLGKQELVSGSSRAKGNLLFHGLENLFLGKEENSSLLRRSKRGFSDVTATNDLNSEIKDATRAKNQGLNRLSFKGYACTMSKNGGLQGAWKEKLGAGLSHLGSLQNGQDAYFLEEHAFGIADGVGGWSDIPRGDPALFSLLLMHYANENLNNLSSGAAPSRLGADSQKSKVDLIDVLKQSNEMLKRKAAELNIRGSTTALLVTISDDQINIANMGDSGLLVIRDNKLVFQSEELLHCFNFPYQLGPESPDSPSDALLQSVKIQKDDVIVSGSDGLFDNVYVEDIIELARRHKGKSKYPENYPQILACAILEKVKAIFSSPRLYRSPFEMRARCSGIWNFRGPKPDDTTVLVALVL